MTENLCDRCGGRLDVYQEVSVDNKLMATLCLTCTLCLVDFLKTYKP